MRQLSHGNYAPEIERVESVMRSAWPRNRSLPQAVVADAVEVRFRDGESPRARPGGQQQSAVAQPSPVGGRHRVGVQIEGGGPAAEAEFDLVPGVPVLGVDEEGLPVTVAPEIAL